MSETIHHPDVTPLQPTPSFTSTPNVSAHPAAQTGKPALSVIILSIVLTVLIGLVMYQQSQISHLNEELSLVSDSAKASDVKNRLASQETTLNELNGRLAYLDSKISATDKKAQEALDKINAHQKDDVIGNMVHNLKQTFGLQ